CCTPTSRTCSCRSCGSRGCERLPDPVLQGGAALHQGRVPDACRPDHLVPPVPADLRACPGGPCPGLRQRRLHLLPGPGPGDDVAAAELVRELVLLDRKSTRLNSSHVKISYAVFCLKKKKLEKYFSFKIEYIYLIYFGIQ